MGFPERIVRFSKDTVKDLALPAGKVDHIMWETGTPGFGLRVRAGADGKINRSWICQYRVGRKSRRMSRSFGQLDCEAARRWAKTMFAQVALGQDPQAEKQAVAAKKDTFKSTVGDYLKFKKRKVRPKSYAEASRYLTKWYFAPLGSLALGEITRADVARALNVIDAESGPIVAARARAQISVLFTWALQQGLCEINAVLGTARPEAAPPRTRVLRDDELAAIWRACEANTDYDRCVKLLILTAARRQETGSMRWSELDFEQGVWRLPPERAKNGCEHVLPILPAMADILRTVAKRASNDCLFGTRAGGFRAWSQGKKELDARLKFAERFTIHDIRRSVSTGLGNLGVLPHVIEEILGHRSYKSGVAATYNRSPYSN
jgi:integrase